MTDTSPNNAEEMENGLETFMYRETLGCLARIDAADGYSFLTCCSEVMADIVESVDHVYSTEAVYRLAGVVLQEYPIVAGMGIDQFDLSFQLYNQMLEFRKEMRKTQFENWVQKWTQHTEETMDDDAEHASEALSSGDDDDDDDDEMHGLMAVEETPGETGPVLCPGVNAFDEQVLAGLTLATFV